MKLHVLTACTRPWNLVQMASSMRAWGEEAAYSWHIRFDYEHLHVGGQWVKNRLLDDVPLSNDYVMFLDDDTIAHEGLWSCLSDHDGARAIVVSQNHSVLGELRAEAGNVTVGKIDIGQAIIKRSIIGGHRIPETYAGDGEFLEVVLGGMKDVVYVRDVLSYHNALG